MTFYGLYMSQLTKNLPLKCIKIFEKSNINSKVLQYGMQGNIIAVFMACMSCII